METVKFVENSRSFHHEMMLKRLWGELFKPPGQGRGYRSKDAKDFWNDMIRSGPHSVKSQFQDLKNKFKCKLPFPSVRMCGCADFRGILGPNEIFIKIRDPRQYNAGQGIHWRCQNCKLYHPKDGQHCLTCGAKRVFSKFVVLQGTVGLLKNPCLHPWSWRRANAIYNDELDAMFPGPVFLFCSRDEVLPNGKLDYSMQAPYNLVNRLSGGDLDGDDFLVVMQQDLLPLPDEEVARKFPELDYDADPPKKKKYRLRGRSSETAKAHRG
eukprot:TRINITY_DN161_c0_g1_i1.p2 TRINITY_DN161_c0_g1~~TRINITY_DN161_c0_g1_i1.p2  ORF type:complete len:268 (-),score=53.08 TRINITY_DN161_c0_g1_i1:2-805(-)